MKTVEFLLWSNCPNNCRFCWQRLFHDETTWLNEQQMLTCIDECSKMIDDNEEVCDILLVGGEVFGDLGQKVNERLKALYGQIVEKINEGKVRFLYANTNLTYSSRTNLVNLLESFSGLEEKLKFTTSFDLDGRFNRLNEQELQATSSGIACTPLNRKEMFLNNIGFINDNFPKINTVVNTIVTKAVFDAVIKEDYDPFWLMKEYPSTVVYVNLIPYIPIEGDDGLDLKFSETLKVLEKANKEIPGYLLHYVENLDDNQDKQLFEYHKDRGYIERTADTMPCGHNENFKLVNRADECFLCKLKTYCVNNYERLSS